MRVFVRDVNWDALMDRERVFLILLLVVLCVPSVAWAQGSLAIQELFSPFNARTFHKLAYESYTYSDAESKEAEQAIIFLNATITLDNKAGYVFVDILNLCSQFIEKDYSQALDWAFENYADDRADLEVTKKAVRYLLERLNSRQEREDKLTSILKVVEEKNPVLTSELTTQLALLSAEKADIGTAMGYLTKAYSLNPYNKLAFTKLAELGELIGQKVHPGSRAGHLRRAMMANPLDISAAIAFAQYVEERGMYSISASAYEYAAELFNYLYPESDLPASIYLPWAIASYNTLRGQGRCLEIARRVRRSGRFDIVLEAIAGSAARKMGDSRQSREMLQAGQKAEKMLTDNSVSGDVTPEQLGWFYCFASPNTEKALAWANRAYSVDPNSPATKSILAYALAMNKQMELAAELIVDLYKSNQIAAATRGLVQLAGQDRDGGIESLKAAVTMDPTSLAAEKAKALLVENGSEYIPDTQPEIIIQMLRTQFGERIVPRFTPVDKIISAKLSLNGSEFFYGGEFGAKLVVTNKSSEPLVISDDGIFKGSIRVDADVRGDITANIPKLISKKIRPSAPIEPGYYAAIPLDVMTGPLRKLLLTYPQASVEIEFTVYLDPVVEANGKVRNAIRSIEPVRTVAKRQGVVLTRKYLMQRLDVLSKGQVGQKLRASELFAGLLMEQYAMSKSKLSYRPVHVERALLTDAIRRSLTDEDWKVKLQTMAAMLLFPAPLDYNLTRAVSENLNDSHWPVRMMALYLLSNLQGDVFKQVLDWTAKYDSNVTVQSMAIALGAEAPQVPQAPQVTSRPEQSQ